jgi:DNA-binding response OmpR family regulator
MYQSTKTRVLVVDDDPALLAAHSLHLVSLDCDVLTAEDGRRALEQVRQFPADIDIILSDIVMPEMDGYALCRAVKSDVATCEIPLIFVSQLSSLAEKMKGFEAGADDYITKPISPEELGFKISNLLKFRVKNRELSEQLSESNNVALQAMSYSSDLGQILEFYKSALNAAGFDEVARLLFDVTRGYGLKCSLQIVTPEHIVNFGSQGAVSPLEANVIELSRGKGRVFDFGSRTLINYQDFSLLVKNMPLDDPERYGTLKDALGALCNAVEARIKFLLHENAAQRKRRIVNAVISMMEEVDAMFTQIQQQNAEVITDMIDELDEAMLDLGLTANQEDLVREIIIQGRERSTETFKSGAKLYDKFSQVRAELDNALGVN